MDMVRKQFNFEVKQIGEEKDRTLRLIGSTESIDRDSDIIEVAGWQTKEYMANPVFLWCHTYDIPPIGKCLKVEKDVQNKKLAFDIKFPTIAELSSDVNNPADHAKFVDMVYNMYKGGYLNATSVGFRGIESKIRDDPDVLDKPDWARGRRYMKQNLLELSAVPVPANPEALQEAKSKGLISDVEIKSFFNAEEKGAIPYKSYPTMSEDTAWDGPKEVAAAEVADLKIMCTWYDSDNADVKSSYKLPHHQKDGYKVVWNGVKAAMGALLGARGGTKIPDADREKVYNHLAKHYKDFDKEAPEFKKYTDIELKSMFPETKKLDLDGNPSTFDIMRAVYNAIDPANVCCGIWIEDLYPIKYPDGHVIVYKEDKFYQYDYTYKDGTATLQGEGKELENIYAEKPKSFLKPIDSKSGARLSRQSKEKLSSVIEEMKNMEGTCKGCRDKIAQFMDGDGPASEEDDRKSSTDAPANTPTPETKMKQEDIQAIAAEVVKLLPQVPQQKQEPEPTPNDANEVEIDLDAIDIPNAAKEADNNELDIKPEEIAKMMEDLLEKKLRQLTGKID